LAGAAAGAHGTMLRIFLLNTDYPAFLRWLYRSRPSRVVASYGAQLRARNASLFGTADFMSVHLKAAGHDAIDVHANNRPMQEAWLGRRRGILARLAGIPRRRPLILPPSEPRFYDILEAQIRDYRPDIIYNHDPGAVPAERLAALKPADCRLVAQIAAPLEPGIEWRRYDLVISSLPNYVDTFRRQGVTAAYLPLAFDDRILEHVWPDARDVGFSFVGSLFDEHGERRRLLEHVAARCPIEIWGHGRERLAPDSPIASRHRGVAWGRTMYDVIARSRLSLNKHIDISATYANNMRLFEATGVGALLLTDAKDNLGDLFEPGREVIAYHSAEQCVDLARYYLEHDGERQRIAAAGQARCLRDHSYRRRMTQLSALLQRHFG